MNPYKTEITNYAKGLIASFKDDTKLSIKISSSIDKLSVTSIEWVCDTIEKIYETHCGLGNPSMLIIIADNFYLRVKQKDVLCDYEFWSVKDGWFELNENTGKYTMEPLVGVSMKPRAEIEKLYEIVTKANSVEEKELV